MILNKTILSPNILEVAINGDLDASNAVEIDSLIKKAFKEEKKQILFDCTLLNYISSAGMGVFIAYLNDFTDRKGGFVFFNMNANVYSVFELLGVHKIFNIVGDRNTAVGFLDIVN